MVGSLFNKTAIYYFLLTHVTMEIDPALSACFVVLLIWWEMEDVSNDLFHEVIESFKLGDRDVFHVDFAF